VSDTEIAEQRIEPSELVYFKKVSEGANRAQQMEIEAASLTRQATALRGAFESWANHLIERYGLDPERDQVNPETGVIERNGRAHTNGRAEAD
jgi:hypothetical protein